MSSENEKILKETIKSVCRLEISEEEKDLLLEDEHCNIVRKLGFDSLLIVELIVEIECAFDIEMEVNGLDISVLRFYDGLKNTVNVYLEK